MTKLNAAVIVLAERKEVFKTTIELFYSNWNSKFDYPVYVHTFGKIFKPAEKNYFAKKYKKIFFIEIYPEIPKHINHKDLFYNRYYNDYVFKNFSPLRLGYLHMCHFAANITSFGKKGCISSKLKNYDYIMRIDDDSWFKKRINFDFFKKIKNYPMATGRLTKMKRKDVDLTRENLLKFYKKYIYENYIKVKNKKLSLIIKEGDPIKLNLLSYSLGNFDLYNMKLLKEKRFPEFIDKVNKYGGIYKYRWGDYDLIDLFLYMFYEKPIFDLKLSKSHYETSHPLAKRILINPLNKTNIFSHLFYRFLTHQIKKRFYKIFN